MPAKYRDLPKFVDKPELAVINAYIGSSSNFSLDKSSNCYVLSGKLGSLDMSISMLYSNADGTRGGGFASPEWTERSGYKKLSDQIHKRMDRIVKPWTDLPNPCLDSSNGKVNEYREKVVAVLLETPTGGLDPTTRTTDASMVKLRSFDKTAPGRMRTLLKDMNDYIPVFEGSAFNTFRVTPVTSMPSVTEDLTLSARVHSKTLLVEQSFLKQLRKKVMEAVEKATDILEETAEEEDGVSFNMLLGILARGCMVATIPGGRTAATARPAGGVPVSLAVPKDIRSLKGSKTAKKATFEANNFEEAVKEFRRTFEETGDGLKATEKVVDENLRYNMKPALEDRARHGYIDTFFHLTPAPIQDVAGATWMDKDTVNQMTVGNEATGGCMSQIAAELERAAEVLAGILMVDFVRRKHNIRMDPTGPDGVFAELRQVLYEPLQDLQRKVDEGNVNFRAAVRDSQENDASSQKVLDAVASNVAQGSEMGPWNHKKQKEGNPRPRSSDNV